MSGRALPADAANAALDRAMSLARSPAVPADLASRIVAQVTQLPQAEASEEPVGRRRVRVPARLLAAALGPVLIVAGASLTYGWLGNVPTASGDRSADTAAAASDKPAVAALGDAVRAPPPVQPDSPRPDREDVAVSSTRDSGTSGQMARPAGQPVATGANSPSEPVERAAPVLDIEFAEQSPVDVPVIDIPPVVVADASEPIGPLAPEGDDANAGNPLIGPPAPQGLGIAGGTLSPPPSGSARRSGSPRSLPR